MKLTIADVRKIAEDTGLEPIQIDGIPEGFSYKRPDVTIGKEVHKGTYLAFIPLRLWNNEMKSAFVEVDSPDDLLLTLYDKAIKERDGK